MGEGEEVEQVVVEGPEHPWVSRGGVKLAAGLDAFGIDPSGRTCLDVGASTGGFTHVLLTRGAARVYAVDVGHGQLHAKLRSDPRVVLREGVNARLLSRVEVPEACSLLVADVSFISLRLILPAAVPLLSPGAEALLLVKPQFESERGEVGRGGIVRDPEVRRRATERVLAAAEATGLTIAPNANGHAYIMSNFQHPGEGDIGSYTGADKAEVLAAINAKWDNKKKAAIGYIGTATGALPAFK